MTHDTESSGVDGRSVRSRAGYWLAERSPSLLGSLVRARACVQSRDLVPHDKRALLNHLSEHGRTLRPDRDPVSDMQPWIQFQARSLVTNWLPAGAQVLEFGAGGSTLYWLRNRARVVTIEHEASWAQLVRRRAESLGSLTGNLDLRVVVPTKGASAAGPGTTYYSSTDASFAGMSFKEYAHAADDLAPSSVDLLVVDGRARHACLLQNLLKVKPGGVLLLDNSERPEYQDAIDAASAQGWRWQHFPGPFPYLRHFSRTSLASRIPLRP
jgi:hypothetical protein